MPAPGIITGRNLLAPDGLAGESQGRFFSSFPASTPKLALNVGPRRSEFTETMARLIVDLPGQQMASLLRSLPGDTAAAAQTLLYNGNITNLRNGNANGAGYFDFLLTQVSQQQQEREQCVDTLTDNTVVYYSGQSAPQLSCAGYFLNSYQDDQNVWFQLLYSDILRGTQLARRGLIARFRYDSFFISGYLSNFAVNTSGDAKNYVQFSFTFRVKQIQIATPIIYNPTLTSSLFASNVFVRTSPAGADDVTRHGVETSEQPAAPRAVPAASVDIGADTRDVAVTQGVPPRERQAVVDHTIVSELETSAQALPADPAALQAIDTATAPVTAASGDVRQLLPAEQAQIFQNFDTPTPTPARPSVDTRIEEILRNADTRGTVIVSPVTGAPERTGSYADTIARAPTTGVSAAEAARRPVSNPGASAAPILDQDSEDLADVYRPPPQLLAEFLRARQAQDTPQLRSRQRATG